MRHLSVVRRSQTQQHCFNCPFQLAKLPDDARLQEALQAAATQTAKAPAFHQPKALGGGRVGLDEESRSSSLKGGEESPLLAEAAGPQLAMASTPAAVICEKRIFSVCSGSAPAEAEASQGLSQLPTLSAVAPSTRSATAAAATEGARGSWVVGIESLFASDWTSPPAEAQGGLGGVPSLASAGVKGASFCASNFGGGLTPTLSQLEAFARSRSCLCQDSPEAAALYSMNVEEGDLIVCATDGERDTAARRRAQKRQAATAGGGVVVRLADAKRRALLPGVPWAARQACLTTCKNTKSAWR